MLVIIGQNCGDAAKALSELPLIKKVIQVEAAHYENFVAENFAPVVVKLARKLFTYYLFSKYIWKKLNAKNCSSFRYFTNK